MKFAVDFEANKQKMVGAIIVKEFNLKPERGLIYLNGSDQGFTVRQIGEKVMDLCRSFEKPPSARY